MFYHKPVIIVVQIACTFNLFRSHLEKCRDSHRLKTMVPSTLQACSAHICREQIVTAFRMFMNRWATNSLENSRRETTLRKISDHSYSQPIVSYISDSYVEHFKSEIEKIWQLLNELNNFSTFERIVRFTPAVILRTNAAKCVDCAFKMLLCQLLRSRVGHSLLSNFDIWKRDKVESLKNNASSSCPM